MTIDPGDNWQTKINGEAAGTASNPVIFGVTAGAHQRAQTLNAFPKSHHWFVGESDGIPTTRFPSGSPTSVVVGSRTSAPGTDMFFGTNTGTGATGVKLIMLEIDGFSPISVRYVMGGPSCNDWYLSHVNQHHSSEGGMRLGWGWHMRYCWVHHNGRDGMTAHNQQPSNEWLQDVIVEDTEVSFNNQFGYAPNVSGSHAGGSKFIATRGMIVRRCNFSNNGGPGIWFDSFSDGVQVLDNITWDNRLGSRNGEGIFLEILECSNGALVEGNDVRRNGGAANIYISNSRGSAAHPIRVNDNFSEEHIQWEIMGSNVDRSPFPELDWVEITNNTMRRVLFNNNVNGARALTGAFTSAAVTQLQAMDMVWDSNAYFWDTQVLLHGNPFLRNVSSHNFTNWKTFGYDPNSTFTEV